MYGAAMRTPLAAALAAAAAVIAPAAAPAATGRGADQEISAERAGKVVLGASYRSLRSSGLLGRLRPGCPLAGTDTRVARLKAPLKGTADLTRRRPREVRAITVTGGASARGVGIGDRIADIRSAFPKAKVDRRTEEVFGITLVNVPKGGGGRIQFAVDVDSRKVTRIAVPAIQFCE
jgi:hypothetical protein